MATFHPGLLWYKINLYKINRFHRQCINAFTHFIHSYAVPADTSATCVGPAQFSRSCPVSRGDRAGAAYRQPLVAPHRHSATVDQHAAGTDGMPCRISQDRRDAPQVQTGQTGRTAGSVRTDGSHRRTRRDGRDTVRDQTGRTGHTTGTDGTDGTHNRHRRDGRDHRRTRRDETPRHRAAAPRPLRSDRSSRRDATARVPATVGKPRTV